MQAALPSALKLSSETTVALSPDYVLDSVALNDFEYLIVEALQIKPKITVSEVSEIIGFKKVMPLVHSMMEKGILVMEEELNEKYKAKYERFVRLAAEYRDEAKVHELMDTLTKRAYKQLEVLLAFITLGGDADNDVMAKTLLQKANANSTILKNMAEKGVFEVYERRVSRLKEFKVQTDVDSILLTEAQQKAYEGIKAGFGEDKPVLLHGVTSSGKTEIYIKLIKDLFLCRSSFQGYLTLFTRAEIILLHRIIDLTLCHILMQISVHLLYGTNTCDYSPFGNNARDLAHRFEKQARQDKLKVRIKC
jgi:primosomal protein N' (replication factor Y)